MKTDYSKVEKSIKRSLDLTKDFRAIFLEIIGKLGDRREWTIIGSIQTNFIGQRAPSGSAWDDLSAAYAKRKSVKYPSKSILIATGALFNSLVYKDRGNVQILEPKKMTFGTVLPHAIFHMTGTSKMRAREFLGFSESQIKTIKNLIHKSVKETWEDAS